MKLLNLGCGNRYHPDWVNVDTRPAGPDVLIHDLRHNLPFVAGEFDVVYHSHLLEHFSKRSARDFLDECIRVLKPGGIIRVVVPDLEQIVKLYLALLEKSRQGDEEAQKRYEWITLEMIDQMVRETSGGEMLSYWKKNPMPAESFVIERVGSEVLSVLALLRQQGAGTATPSDVVEEESDPAKVGHFRRSGEVHLWMYDSYSLSELLQRSGFQNVRRLKADESAIPRFNDYLLDIEDDGSVRKPDSLFMEAQKP